MPPRRQGTKQLKLDPSIYEAMQKEKVTPGDVIYVEANSGAVKRVGRSDAFATEFDLEAEEYVPLPKGAVHKKKGPRLPPLFRPDSAPGSAQPHPPYSRMPSQRSCRT